MHKPSVIIPAETIKNCRGVLLDLGSTLLEYENTPPSELIPLSFKSAYDYLIENSPKTPDYDTFYEKFREILKKFQQRAANEFKEYSFSDVIAPLLTLFRIPPTPELLHGFFEHYYLKITQQVTPYPGAKTTLTRLKAAGLGICIVSNTCFPGKVHRAELARFGLFKYIDSFVFSSDLGIRKPHRDIYFKALRRLGLEADEVVFAGDRQREDVLGPQMAGIAAVLIRRPHREYEPGLTSCPEINGVGGLHSLLEL
jgi:putative hydrolase of the HAD superfamily